MADRLELIAARRGRCPLAWRNPQARLLEGAAWAAIRGDVLTTLSLPADPDALLGEHARALDAAYRKVGGRLAVLMRAA